MKAKIFALLMAVIVITLAIVACVDIPIGNKPPSPESHGDSQSNSPNVSLPQNSTENSKTPSENPNSSLPPNPPVSSNEPSEESHDESHVSKPPEESSEDPQNPLPYKNITSLTYNDIKKDELDSYFENSVFIGNSIMVHFKNYYSNKKASIPGFLGKAQFFCRSNYSAATDMLPIRDDTWQPFVGEEKLNSWDAVAKLGVKKVFINLMALNEIGYNGVDRTIKNTCTMIERIREKSPDVQVIIMSNTYLVKNYNNFEKLFNNDNISKFNNRILQYCNENGLDFIDVSTFLMEGKFLKNEYCIDWELLPNKYGCHLNNNAFAMWTATLRNYAYAKNKGFYKNPSVMPSYTKNG